MEKRKGINKTVIGSEVYKVLKFYATLRDISMQDLYAKALIMYTKHIWNKEFDEYDRKYLIKKLKLNKETVEMLEDREHEDQTQTDHGN